MSDERCGGCRYFRADEARARDEDGECRRRSPSLVIDRDPSGAQRLRSEWPPVWRDDWCGGFRWPSRENLR